MPEFKEMPYFEKYDLVTKNIEFGRQLSAEFVEEHLGSAAKSELEQIVEQGINPIPERGSSKDKYEAAYQNWIWIGKNDFEFVRKRMGELGLVQFEQAEVEALVQKNSSLSTMSRSAEPTLCKSSIMTCTMSAFLKRSFLFAACRDLSSLASTKKEIIFCNSPFTRMFFICGSLFPEFSAKGGSFATRRSNMSLLSRIRRRRKLTCDS